MTTTTALPDALEKSTIRRVTRRIMPFLIVLYLINFLDRTNVGFAAPGMEADLGIGPAAYGLGAGIFFIAYFLFEVPSNVALFRFGARKWIARIMVTWGIIAGALAFIQSGEHFFILRFLLGAAEAGFYPGIIFYISLWYPARYRARMTGIFFLGIPIAQVIGAPLSGGLIQLGDAIGFQGWRMMYLVEAIPAIILGIVTFFYLTDRPAQAKWLNDDQRTWLSGELAHDEATARQGQGPELGKWAQVKVVLKTPMVWALAGILFCMTAGSNALNFFFPSVVDTFKSSFGVETNIFTNGLIVAIPYAFAAAAMILWSRHSDKTLERRFHGGGAAVLAGVSIVIALLLDNPVAIVVGFIVLASGIYSAQIVFWTVPARILTGVAAAAGIGLINSVGNLSGFVGPYLTGWIYENTGSYTLAFGLIATLVVIGGVAFTILLTRRKVR
jgi:MFS family permease